LIDKQNKTEAIQPHSIEQRIFRRIWSLLHNKLLADVNSSQEAANATLQANVNYLKDLERTLGALQKVEIATQKVLSDSRTLSSEEQKDLPKANDGLRSLTAASNDQIANLKQLGVISRNQIKLESRQSLLQADTLNATRQQLGLNSSEARARMIREQARPKLSFSPAINYYGLPFPDNFTESLNGTTYNVLPASRENKSSVYYIKITNNGNAPLLKRYNVHLR